MSCRTRRRAGGAGFGYAGFLASLTLSLFGGVAVNALADTPNYIQVENAKAGTSDWQLTQPGLTSGIIEGYASLTSVNRGGIINLFVNTAEPSYSMDIFRMGYYGGLGGRRMLDTIWRAGTSQPAPTTDPTTGLTECNWLNPYVLTIPNTSDPTDWMSGIYLVKLTAGVSGTQQYIIFAVRDDARPTDMLMAQTVNTYQAYNPWGGKSLYGTIQSPADTAHKAMKVSFNRPYYGVDSNGVSAFFSWEFGMIQWLEQNGSDISYATNVDVDGSASLLLSHKVFLSIGHDEYWTWSMRDHVEAARDQGVNLGFFSGNVSYWQVRYEPSTVTNDPNRTLVGYKEFWQSDPITPDYLKTNEFRYPPVNRPEDALIGVSYITVASPPMLVEDASHWVFTGTGLHNGDVLTYPNGAPTLGYEIDQMGPGSPANTRRLAHSPVPPDGQNFADTTIYMAPSGATVFAAGSIGWPITLAPIAQMTRNVFARFLTGAFIDQPPVRPSLPSPFQAQDLGDVGRPGFVAAVGDHSLTINGAGQDQFFGNDALYFVSQPLSGDGEITARLTELQLFWGNRAGVMIRQAQSPDAPYVSLMARPTGSRGAVNEGVEFIVKNQTGGWPAWQAAADLNHPNWLRLSRQGGTVRASTSADGVNWVTIGSSVIQMADPVSIGVEVASARHGVWTTAMFDNLTVVTGPTTPATDCTSLSLSQTTFSSGAAGNNWPVTVTAPTGTCTWMTSSDSSWLTVTTAQPISVGSGSIVVQTDPNTGASRVGHVTIGGTTYLVQQDAAGPPTCSAVTLSQTSFYSGAIESDWPVTVTTPDNSCNWTASSDSSWLAITPSAGSGNGSILVHTDTNAAAFRVGHFTIAGTTYTVQQEGGSSPMCSSVTLSQTYFYSGAIESDWPVTVTTPDSSCPWTVSSDSSWLVVTPSTGSGNGSILVHTDTNSSGAFRVGHFTISGVTYTVYQETS